MKNHSAVSQLSADQFAKWENMWCWYFLFRGIGLVKWFARKFDELIKFFLVSNFNWYWFDIVLFHGNLEIKVSLVYFLGHVFLQSILVLLGCLSDSILAEMYVCIHFVCTYMYAAELYVYHITWMILMLEPWTTKKL